MPASPGERCPIGLSRPPFFRSQSPCCGSSSENHSTTLGDGLTLVIGQPVVEIHDGLHGGCLGLRDAGAVATPMATVLDEYGDVATPEAEGRVVVGCGFNQRSGVACRGILPG